MKATDLLKDIYSDLDIKVRRVKTLSKNQDVKELITNGFLVNPGYVKRSTCVDLVEEIKRIVAEGQCRLWRDELNSDIRIYGLEAISELVGSAIDVQSLRAVGESYLGRKLSHYFVLGAQLNAVAGNLGSGGGWHRDSAFRHQFKAIFYLSDVTLENGPFEYLRGSHNTSYKIRQLNRFQLGQTRFEPLEVSQSDPRLVTMPADAGTAIFADTRGIHRGRPIVQGTRYALTYYFWGAPPPPHFNELLQGPVSEL